MGFSQRGAAAALRPLVTGSVEAALSARGIENLTGPLARGDAAAVLAHLAALPGGAADRLPGGGVRSPSQALAEQGLISEKQAPELDLALTGQASVLGSSC